MFQVSVFMMSTYLAMAWLVPVLLFVVCVAERGSKFHVLISIHQSHARGTLHSFLKSQTDLLCLSQRGLMRFSYVAYLVFCVTRLTNGQSNSP